VTIPHRTPRFLISLPHNSRSFLNRGSPPVRTTMKFSGFGSIVSSADKKSVSGISLTDLSAEQSLPQCRQFRLHLRVHSQNKYVNGWRLVSTFLNRRNKLFLSTLNIYFSSRKILRNICLPGFISTVSLSAKAPFRSVSISSNLSLQPSEDSV